MFAPEVTVCVCVRVCVLFTLTDRASAIPCNIYVVANPVRGLLDRKIS